MITKTPLIQIKQMKKMKQMKQMKQIKILLEKNISPRVVFTPKDSC